LSFFASFRRNQLEVEAFLTQQTLLAEFLTHLKRLKDDQLMQLRRETSVIQADLDKVNKVIQVGIWIIAAQFQNQILLKPV
jgi:hypothetical protein